MRRITARVCLFVIATLAIAVGAARSQPYPSGPVRVISGLQTGGVGDIIGRMIAQRLAERLAHPFVFEARTGAGGVLAAQTVRVASPDGHSLLFISSGTFVTAPYLIKNFDLNGIRDFTPISLLISVPSFLAINASLPINSVADLISYAKANPGQLAYGSVGRGSAFHMIGEALKLATGIDMLHVPYAAASSGTVASDLMTNRIQVYFPSYTTIQPALGSGNVKLVGVFDQKRSKLFPDMPTINETLPNNILIPSWFALFGPAGMPDSVVELLQKEVKLALEQPKITAMMDQLGITAVGSSGSELKEAIQAGLVEIGALAKILAIEPN
jgi:tripartite-type tricarboxylate transporter receptor subunit TctC